MRNAVKAKLKKGNDTGYMLPMAVELGKASLPFGSPMLCAYRVRKDW